MPYVRLDSTNVLNSSSSFGNQWYFNGAPITGASTQQYIPKQSGKYTVMVSRDGCNSDLSDPINFVAENLGVQLYPNPASDYLYLYQTQNRSLGYEIVNMYGKRMATGDLLNNSTKIYIANFGHGEYFIRLRDKKTSKKVTIPFVKI